METFVSIVLGLSLAATAGLRAFLPLFLAGLFARTTHLVDLSSTFDWLQSTPALIALGVAVVAEIAADKVPALDHLLDVIQAPVRTCAGVVVAAAVMADMPGWLTAIVAIVAGGGALSVHATKSLVRVGSTTTTAGVANPFISIVEDVVALLASLLSIVLWFVAAFVSLLLLVFMALALRWALRRRRERRAAAGPPT